MRNLGEVLNEISVRELGRSMRERNPSLGSGAPRKPLGIDRRSSREIEIEDSGKTICPECNGMGKVVDIEFSDPEGKTRYKTCENCGGTGELESREEPF